MAVNLDAMTTEARNPNTTELDRMTMLEIVTAMNREDSRVPQAVAQQLPNIAKAAEWARCSLEQGGRVFYVGAGTSGRLGVLDAAECPPTFGVPSGRIVGIIAGGERALTHAVEGAEDDPALGRSDLVHQHLKREDLVIGIAASGRTPYVLGALDYARKTGCRTVAIACNAGSEIGQVADLAIEVLSGPEVLTGSTRLKAGTAQKNILNMISTAAMVGLGKAYQNLMVDVMQTNEKLRVRAERIVMEATGVSRAEAKAAIVAAAGNAKTAVTMLLASCSAQEAQQRLARAQWRVREAIQQA